MSLKLACVVDGLWLLCFVFATIFYYANVLLWDDIITIFIYSYGMTRIPIFVYVWTFFLILYLHMSVHNIQH